MSNKSTQIIIGSKYSIKEKITEEKVLAFAGISGDLNPIHINDNYAQNTILKKRICHGMYPASLISKVIGMYLPGPGTIYISQTLEFKKPIYLDDEIEVIVEVEKILKEKNRFQLITKVWNQKKECVLNGIAIVRNSHIVY